MGAAGDFVTIKTLDDPVQAEMIRDVLAQAGIHASTQGAEHRGMLGLAGGFIQIPIQVPADRAEEALELIAALDHPDAVVVEDDAGHLAEKDEAAELPAVQVGEGPYRASHARLSGESPRLKRVAAFCSLALTFGTGHFYVRENSAGIVLLIAELVALGVAVAVEPTAGLAIVGLVLVDLIGSVRAVERANRGERRSRALQVGLTAGWSVASIGAAVVFGPTLLARLDPPPPEAELFFYDPAPYPTPYGLPGDPAAEDDLQELLDLMDRGNLDPALPLAPFDDLGDPMPEPGDPPADPVTDPGLP